MASFDETLSLIRRIHQEIGSAELSRLSGVPYTTLRDVAARNFEGPAVETLRKLAAAAEARVAANEGAPPTGVAAA